MHDPVVDQEPQAVRYMRQQIELARQGKTATFQGEMVCEGHTERVVLHHETVAQPKLFLGRMVVLGEVAAASRPQYPHDVLLVQQLSLAAFGLELTLLYDHQFTDRRGLDLVLAVLRLVQQVVERDTADLEGTVLLHRQQLHHHLRRLLNLDVVVNKTVFVGTRVLGHRNLQHPLEINIILELTFPGFILSYFGWLKNHAVQHPVFDGKLIPLLRTVQQSLNNLLPLLQGLLRRIPIRTSLLTEPQILTAKINMLLNFIDSLISLYRHLPTPNLVNLLQYQFQTTATHLHHLPQPHGHLLLNKFHALHHCSTVVRQRHYLHLPSLLTHTDPVGVVESYLVLQQLVREVDPQVTGTNRQNPVVFRQAAGISDETLTEVEEDLHSVGERTNLRLELRNESARGPRMSTGLHKQASIHHNALDNRKQSTDIGVLGKGTPIHHSLPLPIPINQKLHYYLYSSIGLPLMGWDRTTKPKQTASHQILTANHQIVDESNYFPSISNQVQLNHINITAFYFQPQSDINYKLIYQFDLLPTIITQTQFIAPLILIQRINRFTINAIFNGLYNLIQMKNHNNAELNEYTARGQEIEQLIEGRYNASEQRKEWSYDQEVKEMSSKNKYKYQEVDISQKIQFLDDMKHLIFDAKNTPEDANLFSTNTEWRLVGFEEQPMEALPAVPSNNFLKKRNIPGNAIDQAWGVILLEGRLNAKINEPSYSTMHYNLRRRGIFLYNGDIQTQEQETIGVQFTETTFNYQSENDEFYSLKFGQRVLKIKKENQSREVIKTLERVLFICSFRGAYCLRNEVPSHSVEDYVIKEVNVISGTDFVHEHKIKEISTSRYYRQAIGGFFYLLNKQSFQRKTLSGEITLPRWLKSSFNRIPSCEINLITNVIPAKVPLMNLKIKLHESEITALSQNLKYVFPFYKNYLKRTLIVYESNLQDQQVNYMMSQISYPMHAIGLPKNSLSMIGLSHAINAASTLYHQVIDVSHNSKLVSISGAQIFKWTDANPSVKKLVMKGCYVLYGEEEEFFEGLSNNMCLQEFEIDYMDSYNDPMIKHLGNYDAEIY